MLARFFSAIQRILTGRRPGTGAPSAHAVMAQDAARWDMARSAVTPPDVLARLARDESVDVRAAVAANRAAPMETNALLLEDRRSEVREELARKIARLLPDLGDARTQALREQSIWIIERLARDAAVRVRRVLAEEIRASRHIPKEVAWTLALDLEAEVAAPVLEYCPLFTDADLIELIAAARAQGALSALARREGLSEEVSGAVAASLEIPAIASLLANPSARIREETMDRIVQQAREVEALHQPLVMRADLSVRVMHKLSGFVAAELLDRLGTRGGLSDTARTDLRAATCAQIKADMTGGGEETRRAEARDRVVRAREAGTLNADLVQGALDAGDFVLLEEALSELAGACVRSVHRILKSESGKSITALCWRAGLPMRMALNVQRKAARLPAQDVVLARDGVYFPLTEEEMRWQLEFFDVV